MAQLLRLLQEKPNEDRESVLEIVLKKISWRATVVGTPKQASASLMPKNTDIAEEKAGNRNKASYCSRYARHAIYITTANIGDRNAAVEISKKKSFRSSKYTRLCGQNFREAIQELQQN